MIGGFVWSQLQTEYLIWRTNKDNKKTVGIPEKPLKFIPPFEGDLMRIIIYLAFIIAAFKWGDWKNWRNYYPTYLFFIGGDLFSKALLHDYRLWHFTKGIIGNDILRGHLIINIFMMLFSYSSTLLIYLGRFPKQKLKQFFWIFLWVFIYSAIEFIANKYLHVIEYNHGWNIYWSICFNLVMFSVLKVHYSNPLLAWIISIFIFIILYNIFNIPRESFN